MYHPVFVSLLYHPNPIFHWYSSSLKLKCVDCMVPFSFLHDCVYWRCIPPDTTRTRRHRSIRSAQWVCDYPRHTCHVQTLHSRTSNDGHSTGIRESRQSQLPWLERRVQRRFHGALEDIPSLRFMGHRSSHIWFVHVRHVVSLSVLSYSVSLMQMLILA